MEFVDQLIDRFGEEPEMPIPSFIVDTAEFRLEPEMSEEFPVRERSEQQFLVELLVVVVFFFLGGCENGSGEDQVDEEAEEEGGDRRGSSSH